MVVTMDGKANKGSQKWLQILVNEKPEIIETEIYRKLNIKKNSRIEWKSPLMENQYVEYRDNKFLNALEIYDLKIPLESFWPKRGPVYLTHERAETA